MTWSLSTIKPPEGHGRSSWWYGAPTCARASSSPPSRSATGAATGTPPWAAQDERRIVRIPAPSRACTSSASAGRAGSRTRRSLHANHETGKPHCCPDRE